LSTCFGLSTNFSTHIFANFPEKIVNKHPAQAFFGTG
jgi:hypothetical protein